MLPPTNNQGSVYGLDFTPPVGASPRETLKAATREFEAVFAAQLLRGLRRTVPEGGLIRKSAGEEIFQELLDHTLARQASERSFLGLADLLYEQLAAHLPPEDGPGAGREPRDAHRE